MPENDILTASIETSQILVHNKRNRHLQLAEQLIRQASDDFPVDGPVTLFFRKDSAEPNLQLAGIHVGMVTVTAVGALNYVSPRAVFVSGSD